MKTTMKNKKRRNGREKMQSRVAKKKPVDLRLYSVVAETQIKWHEQKQTKQKTLSGSADKLLHIERRAKCLPIYEYDAREWKRDRNKKKRHNAFGTLDKRSMQKSIVDRFADSRSTAIIQSVNGNYVGFLLFFRVCVPLSLTNQNEF